MVLPSEALGRMGEILAPRPDRGGMTQPSEAPSLVGRHGSDLKGLQSHGGNRLIFRSPWLTEAA